MNDPFCRIVCWGERVFYPERFVTRELIMQKEFYVMYVAYLASAVFISLMIDHRYSQSVIETVFWSLAIVPWVVMLIFALPFWDRKWKASDSIKVDDIKVPTDDLYPDVRPENIFRLRDGSCVLYASVTSVYDSQCCLNVYYDIPSVMLGEASHLIKYIDGFEADKFREGYAKWKCGKEAAIFEAKNKSFAFDDVTGYTNYNNSVVVCIKSPGVEARKVTLIGDDMDNFQTGYAAWKRVMKGLSEGKIKKGCVNDPPKPKVKPPPQKPVPSSVLYITEGETVQQAQEKQRRDERVKTVNEYTEYVYGNLTIPYESVLRVVVSDDCLHVTLPLPENKRVTRYKVQIDGSEMADFLEHYKLWRCMHVKDPLYEKRGAIYYQDGIKRLRRRPPHGKTF